MTAPVDDGTLAALRARALVSSVEPVSDPGDLSMMSVRSHLEQTFGKDEHDPFDCTCGEDYGGQPRPPHLHCPWGPAPHIVWREEVAGP